MFLLFLIALFTLCYNRGFLFSLKYFLKNTLIVSLMMSLVIGIMFLFFRDDLKDFAIWLSKDSNIVYFVAGLTNFTIFLGLVYYLRKISIFTFSKIKNKIKNYIKAKKITEKENETK